MNCGQLDLLVTEEDPPAIPRLAGGESRATAATGHTSLVVAPRLTRRRSGRPSVDVDLATDVVRRSLPLTVPAPNWEAWVGRPLRLEIENPRAQASLPMAMAMGDASFPPIPYGRFSGCEFSTGLYWLAESDEAGGALLVPRGHFWVRDGNNGHSEDRGLPGVHLRVADEDGFCRLGACPQEAAAIARRLHREPVPGRWFPDEIEDMPKGEVDALLRGLVGTQLVISAGLGTVFPDAVGQHSVTSLPFPVTAGGRDNGRMFIDGPHGIHCRADFHRLLGVRVSEHALGADVLLDLWREGEGFLASWHLRSWPSR